MNSRIDEITTWLGWGCSNRLSIPPAHPRRAKTHRFPSKAAGGVKAGGVLDLTRHARAGRDRLFPTVGYVEDCSEPRTQLGKGRVSARLG
jgi:hypothetical protein